MVRPWLRRSRGPGIAQRSLGYTVFGLTLFVLIWGGGLGSFGVWGFGGLGDFGL